MSRIISFSSDNDFADGLDNTMTKSGYKNRSRFMRDAVFHFADYKQRGELESMDEDELIEGRKMTKDDVLLFRLSESVRRLCAYARDFGEILLNLKLHDEMISRSK